MSEKIVGLIPARMESSRFPGKPIFLINNKPMIYWVYQNALKVDRLQEVYVVTPNKEIKDVCLKYNIPCLYDDKQGDTAAQKLSFAIKKIDGDIFLNIQGDEPLLNPAAIDEIIDEMLLNKNLYYVGLISKIKTKEDHENRNIVKAVLNRIVKLYIFQDHQFQTILNMVNLNLE